MQTSTLRAELASAIDAAREAAGRLVAALSQGADSPTVAALRQASLDAEARVGRLTR